MDMANATAAGPSYGLLDMIFGGAPKEEKAEGTEFGPMLDMLKALGKKDGETAGDGRTDKETPFGANLLDYRFATTPGMNTAMVTSDNNQALLKWAEDQGVSPAKAQAALLLATIKAQAKQVALHQEELAQATQILGAEQSNLVKQMQSAQALMGMAPVNAQEQSDILSKLTAQHPEATMQLTDSMESAMDSNRGAYQKLSLAGMDQPKNNALKNSFRKNDMDQGVNPLEATAVELGMTQDASSKVQVASDKTLSTQDFMKLQQQMLPGTAQVPVQAQSNGVENSVGKAEKPVSGNPLPKQTKIDPDGSIVGDAGLAGSAAAMTKQNSNSSENKSSSDDQKGSAKEFSSGKEIAAGKKSSLSKESLLDTSLIAGAEHAQKTAVSGLVTKEVSIANPKGNDLRAELMGEVAQNVQSQALKGGGEMKLILHPDHLGELKLKISTKDNRVEVSVMADNDEVAGLLKKSAQDLREALGDKNLSLAKFEVNVSSSTVASSESNRSNMENFFSQQHQMAQDFRSGSNAQDGGRAFQDQDSSRSYFGMLAKPEVQSKAKFIAPAPTINRSSSSVRLDVVA